MENDVNAPVVRRGKFVGGVFAYFFRMLGVSLATCFSLGLAFPKAFCWMMRWKAAHTYIKGKRLSFTGDASDLFSRYIKWWGLSIITLGIYAMIFFPVRLKEWEVAHTHFEGVEGTSFFDGTVGEVFGVMIIAGLVSGVTFGIGSFWAFCYYERCMRGHQVIDGHRLSFRGRAVDLFVKSLLWGLLCGITLGIYSFWMMVKFEDWLVANVDAEGELTEGQSEGAAATNDESGCADERTKKEEKLNVLFSFVMAILAIAVPAVLIGSVFLGGAIFGQNGATANIVLVAGLVVAFLLNMTAMVMAKSETARLVGAGGFFLVLLSLAAYIPTIIHFCGI